MKKLFFLLAIFLVLFGVSSCGTKKINSSEYSYDPSGYYYKLIYFDSDPSSYQPDKVFWVSASFKTQSDSVFWDSFNNLNDKFYIANDSSIKNNFFRKYISRCSALDSVCLLIKTRDFFSQQFKTSLIPFFSQKDSVVKINFKIKKMLSKVEFVKIKHNLLAQEEQQIKKYFGTKAEMEAGLDPLGFYWIYHEEGAGKNLVKPGDMVTLAYKGEYLNGRFLEKSGSNFEFIYGTPDQLLTGLNYVIGRLKLGETAKIILPSRLAFGESGSSNGTVPPFTPLVYEVKLIDLKTNEDLSDQRKKFRRE